MLQKLKIDNPIKRSAMTPEERIKFIEGKYREIMTALDLDVKDPAICDTPKRVAKMMVNELCSGLNPKNFPSCTTFESAGKSLVK